MTPSPAPFKMNTSHGTGTPSPENDQRDTTQSEADEQPVILIADDQPDLVDLYTASLPDDYELRTAENGQEAVELFDERVDVALLDRNMPKMNGDAVLEHIRAEGYRCRVAMLTGVEPDFDILDMGFDEYLVKPISIPDLRDVVDRLLTLRKYDQDIQQYYAFLSKRIALEDSKSDHELESDPQYSELRETLAQLRDSFDAKQPDLDDVDPKALFDDLQET